MVVGRRTRGGDKEQIIKPRHQLSSRSRLSTPQQLVQQVFRSSITPRPTLHDWPLLAPGQHG
eukprot:752988-Hanusia_phi.AAC.1